MSSEFSNKNLIDLISSKASDKVSSLSHHRSLLGALDLCSKDGDYFYDIALVNKEKLEVILSSDINDNELMNAIEIYEGILLYLSHVDFDSYLLFMESRRPIEKKFYLPRRDKLRILVDDLQDLKEDKLDLLCISLPPRVGKSTLCLFFISWIIGLYPDDSTVMSGYASTLTNGFHKEIISLITDDGTYRWKTVFPDNEVVDISMMNTTIDINKKKRFCSLVARGLDSSTTGITEVGNNGILYIDDIIKGVDEALNLDILDRKYDKYVNELKDRKLDGAKELVVGTRWNVYDLIGRLEQQYSNNSRCRFRVIPAVDENGESNFAYPYRLGFTTEYYKDMKESIDESMWQSKYMGKPFVREGLLFPPDELRYFRVLPKGSPDRIYAILDTAWGGGDNLALAIAYQYNEDVYIKDVVYNKGDIKITKPLIIGMVKKYKPHVFRLEANNGGEQLADTLESELRAVNVRVNISTIVAPPTRTKLSRIIQHSAFIKDFFFLEPDARHREYYLFMKDLNTFTTKGKNKNDDAPDVMAMLNSEITDGMGTVTSRDRFF